MKKAIELLKTKIWLINFELQNDKPSYKRTAILYKKEQKLYKLLSRIQK